ncbi:MAG: hypothetical protein FWD77_03780 [Betaproteobacteria bacterium]|nr:hypothetical protein [Betaproteobacteria bacterium]
MSAKATVRVVRDSDGKYIEMLRKRLVDKGLRIKVGIPGDKQNGEGESLAEIGRRNEFGTRTTPERPFLRTSVRNNRQKYNALNRKNLKAVLEEKMTVAQALDVLGMTAAADMQSEIANGHFAPLKPATIKRKGSSKPLIDSGQMRQAITFWKDDQK